MAEKTTLYAVLGLPETAAAADIDPAWRRQRALLEADHALEDRRSRLVFVDHARAVLGDPQKRARYDQQLRAPETPRIEQGTLPARSRWPLIGLLILAGALACRWQHYHRLSLDTQPANMRPSDPHLALQGDAPPVMSGPGTDPARDPRTVVTDTPAETTVGSAAATQPAPRQIEVRTGGPDAELVKKLVWSVYGIVGSKALGTGVMIDGEGLVTNCHVIAANMPLQGKLWAINAVTHDHAAITDVAYLDNQDACLVHAPGLTDKAVEIGSTTWMAPGIKTHNIGYANGWLTASPGEFLTWINRYGQNFLVTNNYCDHGVSGGPLVDDDGRLVGLTTGGSERNHNICASLTVETVRTLQFQTPIPLADFPADYVSNIVRRQW